MKAVVFHAPDPPAVHNVFYGRKAANRALWRALALYGSGDVMHCLTPDRNDALELRRLLDEDGAGGRTLVRLPSLSGLCGDGPRILFRNDPNLATTGWTRRTMGADVAFSLCGLTHTLTPLEVMRWVGDCATAPIHRWDALICTSQAARRYVETLFEIWGEHLRERIGDMGGGTVGPLSAPLHLPVIPLGVFPERFADGPQRDAQRRRRRERLGIAPDDTVVLFPGRLSYYEKAHPYPLFRAIGRASESGRPLHLVLAGRFPDPSHEALYRASAEKFCGRAQVHFVDGGDPDFDGVWAAADIFVSLSDNLQETFGLTPVEAMAAGLPVVVSDWDGYRDTVEHGVTGFRIRTVAPPAGAGEGLGNQFLNAGDYFRHIGAVSQRTAADVGEAAAAIRRLADDPALRAAMGAAGKSRVATFFDWARIVPQYEALWEELDARRNAAQAAGRRYPATTPLSPDPFRLYAEFPSHAVDDARRLIPADDWRARAAAICADPLNQIDAPKGPALELLALVAGMDEPVVGGLLAGQPAAQHAVLRQFLVWLMKMDLLTIR